MQEHKPGWQVRDARTRKQTNQPQKIYIHTKKKRQQENPQNERKYKTDKYINTSSITILNKKHRITEWPGLEGTSRTMNLQPPYHRQGHQPPHLILD